MVPPLIPSTPPFVHLSQSHPHFTPFIFSPIPMIEALASASSSELLSYSKALSDSSGCRWTSQGCAPRQLGPSFGHKSWAPAQHLVNQNKRDMIRSTQASLAQYLLIIWFVPHWFPDWTSLQMCWWDGWFRVSFGWLKRGNGVPWASELQAANTVAA